MLIRGLLALTKRVKFVRQFGPQLTGHSKKGYPSSSIVGPFDDGFRSNKDQSIALDEEKELVVV